MNIINHTWYSAGSKCPFLAFSATSLVLAAIWERPNCSALKTIGVKSPVLVETATATSEFLNCLMWSPCHWELTPGISLNAREEAC